MEINALEIDENWPKNTFGTSRIQRCTENIPGTPSFRENMKSDYRDFIKVKNPRNS